MANRLFSQTPGFNHPRRNAFDLSYLNLLTSNFGDLKVCLCKETVPGDLWQCQSTALVRVAPMLAPVMANIDVYIHYFYVPNRIIWSHWNDFITGGLDGTLDPSTDSDVVPPYFSLDEDFVEVLSGVSGNPIGNRSLWDSLNLPTDEIDLADLNDFPSGQGPKISSLPFRAYQLIYQEYYEDELLKRPFTDPDTGEDVPIDFSSSGNEYLNAGVSQVLRLLYQEKRAWGKDYFTTARPNVALTGDTLIPVNGSFDITGLSGQVPIEGDIYFSGDFPVELHDPNHTHYPTILDRLGEPISWDPLKNYNRDTVGGTDNGAFGFIGYGPDNYGKSFDSLNLYWAKDNLDEIEGETRNGPLYIDPNGSLRVSFEDQPVDAGSAYADLSYGTIEGSGTVTGGTIRDLKLAIQTYEYDAKGQYGNRPTEWHYNHFGVVVPDATIQRPIYLGGGKTPIMVSEVLQNSGSNYSASGGTATPQGNMAGHGIGVARSNKFRHYCEEYGFIIGIMSIIPKTAYYQGVPKMFDRWDKLDYFTPEFAYIGEVPVKNQELFFSSGDMDQNAGTFGYQSPYADLKFSNNEIHGDFRKSLDFWHTGRKFADLPQLNWEFIHCDHADQLSRIFAVESENYDHFYIQCWHNLKATRLMPKFGTFKL